jgi:hypothetical protein
VQWSTNNVTGDKPGSGSGTKQTADHGPKNDVAIDEAAVEVSKAAPFAVRETRRLYRLRAERVIAVVAADTEDEARALAAAHDLFGGDWRNSAFASAEVEETAETHVFGDVVISSVAGRSEPSNRK